MKKNPALAEIIARVKKASDDLAVDKHWAAVRELEDRYLAGIYPRVQRVPKKAKGTK